MKNANLSKNVYINLLLQCSHGARKFSKLGGSMGVRLRVRRVLEINQKMGQFRVRTADVLNNRKSLPKQAKKRRLRINVHFRNVCGFLRA